MTFGKLKNIFIYLISFSSSIIGIILNFFLAKWLGSDQYGEIQYYVAIITTISQITIFGLNSFLIREAKNEKHNGQLINKCLTLFLLINVITLPFVFVILYYFVNQTTSNAFVISEIIVISVFFGIDSLVAAFYQGKGKYQLSIIFENLIPKAILLLLAVIFYIFGRNVEYVSNYIHFYFVIYLLIGLPLFILLFRKFNLKIEKKDIISIVFYFGVTITYSLGNNLTKILQGSLYKDTTSLGIISISLSITGLVRVFTSVLDNLVKPLFAKQHRENDYAGMLETYRFDTRVNSYVAIPLYLFFMIHASKFLGIVGDSYLAYPMILVILSASQAVCDLTGPNGTMLAMTGREKMELVNGFIYFGLYIAGTFAFSFDKIYGLCYSLLLAQIGVNIAKFIEVWVEFKQFPIDLKSLISMVIITIFNFVAIYPLVFIDNLILWLAIGIVVGAIVVILNFVVSLYRKVDFKRIIDLRV